MFGDGLFKALIMLILTYCVAERATLCIVRLGIG